MCSPMLVDKKSSREEIQMSNMGPGRRGTLPLYVGSGAEFTSPVGVVQPPVEVTRLTDCPLSCSRQLFHTQREGPQQDTGPIR